MDAPATQRAVAFAAPRGAIVLSGLLIIVPARGGSKRLPGKNLKFLGGRPLLDHTADAIVGAGLAENRVLLTTDSPEIAEHGRAHDWLVPWLRPAHLAQDDSPTCDVVMHALEWFAGSGGGDPAHIMVLQPTSPLRGSGCLADAVAMLEASPRAHAVVGMRRVRPPGGVLFSADADGFAQPVAIPGDLTPNGAVYVIRSSALRTHRTLFPPRTKPLVMSARTSVDIDTEVDWLVTEALLAADLTEAAP